MDSLEAFQNLDGGTTLKFIESDSKNFFGIHRKYIDQNLDYDKDEI